MSLSKVFEDFFFAPQICFIFVPWNHFFGEQVRIHLTCPPNHFEPKKTKCEFWVVFRSERPVLPIFSPCIMSNENYERKKITIPSLQDVFIEYPQRISSPSFHFPPFPSLHARVRIQSGAQQWRRVEHPLGISELFLQRQTQHDPLPQSNFSENYLKPKILLQDYVRISRFFWF